MVSKLVLFAIVCKHERERHSKEEEGWRDDRVRTHTHTHTHTHTLDAGTVCLPRGLNRAFSKLNFTKQTRAFHSLNTD